MEFTPRTTQQITQDIGALKKASTWKGWSDAFKEGLVQQYTQDQQNAFNVAMWNAENEYNRPENQMARFQDAGLNPNLIYGQTNTAGSAPTSAQGQSWNFVGSTRNKLSKTQMTVNALLEGAQQANAFAGNLSQIEQRKLQNRLIEQQGNAYKWDAETKRQEALSATIRNYSNAFELLGPKMAPSFFGMIHGNGLMDSPFTQYTVTPEGYVPVDMWSEFDPDNLHSRYLKGQGDVKSAETAVKNYMVKSYYPAMRDLAEKRGENVETGTWRMKELTPAQKEVMSKSADVLQRRRQLLDKEVKWYDRKARRGMFDISGGAKGYSVAL